MRRPPEPRPVPPARLHNMSCAPRATVARKGSDRCRRVRIGFSAFFSPPGDKGEKPNLADWCRLLGLAAGGNEEARARRLRQELLAPAGLEHFPAVAPVVKGGAGEALPGVSDDPRLVAAILARSSGSRVFIRQKAPIIFANFLNSDLCLILPEDWRLP